MKELFDTLYNMPMQDFLSVLSIVVLIIAVVNLVYCLITLKLLKRVGK